jgi:hypothetical protein
LQPASTRPDAIMKPFAPETSSGEGSWRGKPTDAFGATGDQCHLAFDIEQLNREHDGCRSKSQRIRMQVASQWLRDHGVHLHDSLSIEDPAGDLHIQLKAQHEILPNELLACIPLSCVLSAKSSALVFDALLPPDMELATCLMHEMLLGSTSRWSGYIAMLPDRVPLPFGWDTRALKYLLQQREMVRSIFACHVRPLLLRHHPHVEMEVFSRACMLVWSRAFIVDETYHRLAMVPLADLCDSSCINVLSLWTRRFNHHYEEDTQIESEAIVCPECGSPAQCEHDSIPRSTTAAPAATNNIEMRAKHGICQRELEIPREVCNTYGALSNSSLLSNYGFLLEANPHDCFALPTPEDACTSQLRNLRDAAAPLAFNISCEGALSPDLFDYIYLDSGLPLSDMRMARKAYRTCAEEDCEWPSKVSSRRPFLRMAPAVLRLCTEAQAKCGGGLDVAELFEVQAKEHGNIRTAATFLIYQKLILKACQDRWQELVD